jgi:branched-chain amino acid transport system permease protein
MEWSSVLDLFITGILRGGLYSLMAAGLALLMGVMRVCSFVHGELYMIGAYAAWFAFRVIGFDPILSLLVAMLASFVAGIAIEKIFFAPLRRRSKREWLLNAYLVTVGLSFVLQNTTFLAAKPVYRGIETYWPGSIQITPTMGISIDRIVAFLISILVIVGFWMFLQRTQMGRAMRAVSEDERGAMLVGIDLDRIYSLSFGLSSMLAGIAGASLLSVIPAFPTMGSVPLIKSWYVVILAGFGNVRGAMIGGFIVGMIEALSYYFLGSGWQRVVSVSILVLILLFKPAGLFGTEVKGVLE